MTKTLRQERAQLITDARAILDAKGCTAEQVAQAEAMLSDADALMGRVTALERAQALSADLGEQRAQITDKTGASADQQLDEAARDKRILLAYLRGNVRQLSDTDQAVFNSRFQNAGSTSSSGGGGYTVAPLFMRELLVAMKLQGGVRGVARGIQTDTGASLPWPTLDDRAQLATIIAAENTQIGADTDLVFGQVSLGCFTYKSGLLPVSLQLLQDSAFDFDAIIKQAIVGRFVRGQNAHFTTGTGTGQPQGIMVGAPIGVTAGGTFATTPILFDNLIDLIHSVDPVYRPDAQFMFHDQTLQIIRKLKDGYGRYLWQPGTTVGAPDTILSYPYTINQDMATPAISALAVAFGDFDHYIIRDVLDMQMLVLRERFADSLQVAYLAFMRTDGRLITAAQPIKTLKMPTS